MKRMVKWVTIVLTLMVIAGMFAGCAKKQEAPATETPNAESTANSKVYESKDGWKISYNPKLFSMTEEENGKVSFSYQGDAGGSNVVLISYHKGKMPSEILYEATANVSDSRMTRSEGWFGGTWPAWTYSRDIEPDEGGMGSHYTAIEHNGGSLMVEVLYHTDSNQERNMDTSDEISGLLDSLTLVNHKPQEELAYRIGTYVREYKEEMEGQEQTVTESITLNEDHTGVMSFQDDIDIIWSSTELIEYSGDNRYEYTVEGDELLLNMNDGGDWIPFQRKK